jgi:hypothetical protein
MHLVPRWTIQFVGCCACSASIFFHSVFSTAPVALLASGMPYLIRNSTATGNLLSTSLALNVHSPLLHRLVGEMQVVSLPANLLHHRGAVFRDRVWSFIRIAANDWHDWFADVLLA